MARSRRVSTPLSPFVNFVAYLQFGEGYIGGRYHILLASTCTLAYACQGVIL